MDLGRNENRIVGRWCAREMRVACPRVVEVAVVRGWMWKIFRKKNRWDLALGVRVQLPAEMGYWRKKFGAKDLLSV